MSEDKKKRVAKWYFGGLGSCGAACITHPLDTIKVMLQTQQQVKMGMGQMAIHVVKTQGFFSLYNGLSASLLRQLTYSTTRFGIYEYMKSVSDPNDMTFVKRVGMAAVAGAAGGLVGTPADMVNVRMQNDIKLPLEQRRNYSNAVHGLFSVAKQEGVGKLFNGATMATSRAVFMTIGQLSFYDQIKILLLSTGFFQDNLTTHFTSSLVAAGFATLLTQPLDVLKTRSMNAKPGEFKSLGDLIMHTAKLGPAGFFKGFIPAFFRLGPHTILTFVFFEQLRMNFGLNPSYEEKKS
ncbi:mitochondrial dicarboxylate carrier [Onthophagus taurus]|uniref:mitochondrial dicarboxylate carrier n=1 Tax=Onthophagus taurus TaxID=166361 RepID=UPI000C200383|nr:mitochondrial dicarboxylate carrier [Onthophagus taurus]